MSNQSPFVKFVIWLMIFLMSVGFAALVITPFLSGSSLFGDGTGRSATEKLVEEAQVKVEKHDCSTAPKKGEKVAPAKMKACQDALEQLASAYTTLSQPDPDQTEPPRDSKRNIARAGEAWKALYLLDATNNENMARYAGHLRDAGDSQKSLDLWTVLVRRAPKNEDYLLQQAAAYNQLGKTDEAIATLRAYIKRFPDSGQVEQIKSDIKALQDYKKQQAAGGGVQTITPG